MNKFLLIGLILLVFSFSVSAAQLLKAPHACVYNSSHTCIALNTKMVGGTIDTPEIVYFERDLNATTYQRWIYEKYDGTKIQLSNPLGNSFMTDASRGLPEHSWDAVKYGNYVYVAFNGFTGTSPITYSVLYILRIDLTTGSSSTFAAYVLSSGTDLQPVFAGFGTYIHLLGSYRGNALNWYDFYYNGTIRDAGGYATGYQTWMEGIHSASLNSTGYIKTYDLGNTADRVRSLLASLHVVYTNYVVGDHSTDTMFFGISPTSYVFNTARDGNYEIYFRNDDGTGLTRLTTTSINEDLSSVFLSTEGTVYLIYRDTASGIAYLDYFCNSSMILGFVCGSAIPTQVYPDVMLTVGDESCCAGAIFGSTDECNHFCLIGNEDWVHVSYTINGKVALPASADSNSNYSDVNVYLHGVNASCRVCQLGDCRYLVFDNPFAKKASQRDWTYNLNEWAGQRPVVVCSTNSSMSDTTLSVRFNVQNSAAVYNVWSLVAGAGNVWNDRVSSSQIPTFKLQDSILPFRSWNGLFYCFLYSSQIGAATELMDLLSSTSSTVGGYNITSQRWGYTARSVVGSSYSYVPYTVSCWDTTGNAYRMPSRVHQRSFAVDSACSSTDPTYIGNFKFKTGEYNLTNGTFYLGQRVSIQFSYIDSVLGTTVNQKGTCNAVVYNRTSGALLGTNSLVCNVGQYVNSCGGNLNYFLSDDGKFPVGDYNVTVTCLYNQVGSTSCMAAASVTKNFSVISGAGCTGEADSCGTTTCSVCPQVVCPVCEDGVIPILSGGCSNQVCDMSSSSNPDCILACYNHNVWSVVAWASQNNYQCIDPKIMIYAELHKNGGLFNSQTVNASCRGTLYAGPNSSVYGQGYSFQMRYNSGTNEFYWNYTDDPNANLPMYCASSYSVTVACTSGAFSGYKYGYAPFNLMSLGQCTDGTLFGQCKYERTGNYGDLPKYCDANGMLSDNASVCGCPPGYSFIWDNSTNATSAGCFAPDVSPTDFDPNTISTDILSSLNLSWILFIVLLGAPILVAYNTFFKHG